MAEFCLECWNKMNHTKDRPYEYILSKDLDICENCGEYKRIIIMKRVNQGYMYPLGSIIFLIRIIDGVLTLLFKILTLPYRIYKRKKHK